MAAYSSQVISLFVLLWYCSTFQTSGTSGVFPFGRSTCVLSALPTSPWSDHPRNRPPFTAPCTLSENVVGVVPFPFSNLFLYLELYPVILRLFHLVVADRRATARTTNPFSHAASIKKCTRSAWSRSPTRRQHQLARMIMVAQTIPRRRIGNIFPCRCRNKKEAAKPPAQKGWRFERRRPSLASSAVSRVKNLKYACDFFCRAKPWCNQSRVTSVE